MKSISSENIHHLVVLRSVVGFLGEQTRDCYWPSGFCQSGSDAFLRPIFPRTRVLAKHCGISSAAALVHDSRIGIGNLFHLFRLPEDMEQALHAAAAGTATSAIEEATKSKESAFRFLAESSCEIQQALQGPVRIGSVSSLRDSSMWLQAAGCYLFGFKNQKEVFPFFSDKK